MATNNAINERTAALGKILQGQGIGNASDYSTATYPSIATSTGTILRADGTNWSATSATYPNTVTAGDLIYASASNVIGSLADVATGQVLASGGIGANPAYTATPTLTSVTFGSGTALSSYVEGTFTPTIIGSSTAGSTSYSNQVGYYKRIGNIVTATYDVAGTPGGTAAGIPQIGALPFTSANTVNSPSCILISSTQTYPGGYTYALSQQNMNTSFCRVSICGSGQSVSSQTITSVAQRFSSTIIMNLT